MTEKELHKFYTDQVDKIYKFFYYKTVAREISEDLTSQTFLRFVEQIRGESEIENYQAFLNGIARNVFLEYLRKKYKEADLLYMDLDFEYYLDQYVDDVQKSECLEDRIAPYIEMLPASQKAVAYKRLVEKKDLKEIVVELGKNMNYVKTTQKRAIKSLKRLVLCTPTLTN